MLNVYKQISFQLCEWIMIPLHPIPRHMACVPLQVAIQNLYQCGLESSKMIIPALLFL